MTLTKIDMIDHLNQTIGLNKSEAKEFVEAFFNEIKAVLKKGDNVKISGLGNFTLRSKKERPGRNPKTGESIPVTARRVVTFHIGQKLKSELAAHKI